MTICRAMVRIPWDSGNPEDVITNTWHFSITGVLATEAASAQTALQNFYNNLATYFTTALDLGVAQCKWYNLEDAEPRTPFLQGVLGSMNSPTGGEPLPEELAICLSYKAQPVSGSPPARRRGRIYIGGLGRAALPTTGIPCRPVVACVTAIKTAGATLQTASESAPNWGWVVYSPTAGTTFAVTGGWVDNAWDIQRRRGIEATTRNVWP